MRFYLGIYFGWEYESPIRFLWERRATFLQDLSILAIFVITSIFMWLISILWCMLAITHFSIFLSSSIFILFLHFTLHHLISFFFSSCLIFDLGSTSTLYSYLFDMSIPLLSLFMWESLGLWLMMFSTHCISCIKGMGVILLGLLSLVSFHFFHPKTLAYVTSRVLRPP